MTPQAQRLEQVRRVLAASGGWNRRARGTLLAWARAEGLSDEALAALLLEALGVRVAPAPRMEAPSTPRVTHSPGPRWWLAVVSAIGLAASGALLFQLARVPVSGDGPHGKPKPPVSTPSTAQGRTQPPPPVPFPEPPGIVSDPPMQPLDPPDASAGLGPRPSGELSRLDLKRFADAWAQASTQWTSRDSLTQAADLRELSEWMAGCVSVHDAEQMDWARMDARERSRDPREAMLREAYDAMLSAAVAGAPNLSSVMASRMGPQAAAPAREALKAWAISQVEPLARGYAAADARARWEGWIQCVSSLSDPALRAQCALPALEAILRLDAPLDRSGVVADAAGSMVALLPKDPTEPGFAAVRDAWARWLKDASLRSPRLWALGGVWRSRVPAIDPSLLPGERDDQARRTQLAADWSRQVVQPAPIWWAPLQAALRAPPPPTDADPARRLEDLADRIRNLRQLARSGAVEPARVVASAQAPQAVQAPTAARWTQDLLDERVETRLRALRAMRAAAPSSLDPADAQALAGIAISGATQAEVDLAQEVMRGSLGGSQVVRQATAHALATAAAPMRSADLVRAWTGRSLPCDGSDAFRAAAIAALLRQDRTAVDAAADRLAAEVAAWQGLDNARVPADAGATAWDLARSAAQEASDLHLPPEVAPLVGGIQDRMRRLRRMAPDGPRALAAALAVLCDAQAARLSVRRAGDAGALRLMADAASARRAAAPDALAQAQASIEALGQMGLLCAGAPSDPVPAAVIRPAMDPSTAAMAMAEFDRAMTANPGDRSTARAALERALRSDVSRASSVALGMACLAPSRRDGRAWLEAADALGAGAMLPELQAERTREALELARVLSWARRGAVDQLTDRGLAESRPRTMDAVKAFAQERGISPQACLKTLRTSADPTRDALLDALRARVAATLHADGASWSDAIAGGAAESVPEADAAQPWRLTLPGS